MPGGRPGASFGTGIEFQDLVEIGQGLVILTFLGVDDTAVVHGVDRSGRVRFCQFYHLTEVGDGEVRLTLAGINDPAIVIGIPKIWTLLERFR